MTAEQLALVPEETPPAAPEGSTPSWFTGLSDFLGWERQLLLERLIPRLVDLDPCGHPEAPVSKLVLAVRSGTVWTAETNGLHQDWNLKVVFLNPGYEAELVDAFLEKRARSNCHGSFALLPSWTDRGWWHRWIEKGRRQGRIDVRFLEGRLHFGWPGNPAGVGGDNASFPSALVVWR